MVTRNSDSTIFALGLIAGIIGVISLLCTCIGVALPSWYIGFSADRSTVLAQANLFYSCYAPNATQGSKSPTLTCVSFGSFTCTKSAYQTIVLNSANVHSGCLNPNSESSVYSGFGGPVYQISGYKFYRLRSSAVFSVMSIVFTFAATLFGFLSTCSLLNIYLAFIAPILITFAVIFGVACLITAGSVFDYAGLGLALFLVGVIIELIVGILLSAIAGRWNGNTIKRYSQEEDTTMLTQRPDSSPTVVRRVLKKI